MKRTDLAPGILAAAALALAAAPACSDDGPAGLTVTLRVVDEADAPLAGATVDLGATWSKTGGDGTAQVTLEHGPHYALVSAAHMLAEPVPLGWEDAGTTVTVRLLSDKDGKRVVIHNAGDVMFGRRFESPEEGAPLVPRDNAATGAVDVVSRIAPVFKTADFRTINLETVVTDRGDDQAYPGKRFILRTRPGALAGVQALGVDVAILANNHQRDFLDDGILDTQAALLQREIDSLGADPGGRSITASRDRTVKQLNVAVAGWTTVDGSFVNDSYPVDDSPVPPDLAPEDAWQYQARTWGFDSSSWQLPEADRRIGSAWRAFDEAPIHDINNHTTEADAWQSMSSIYPELQDWVQRRGHGGAAFWDQSAKAELRTLSGAHDVTILQIHGGFQFQEASSANVQAIAHDVAQYNDADLIVCHHPHVLQGLEWFNGTLIAYSLGNFVFDQDFLSTFPSVILRTVWEGKDLVEARLLPVEIDGYRPTLAVDRAARRILLTIWERSLLRATSDRYGNAIYPIASEPGPGSKPIGLRLEHGTARILTEMPAPVALPLSVPAGGVVRLPDDGLVDPRLGGAAGVSVGRDLFGWGHLDDMLADDEDRAGAHWYDLDHVYKEVLLDDRGGGSLRLQRTSTSDTAVLARPVARVPLPAHRLYSAPGVPLDPDPTYSVRLRARGSGDVRSHLRVDIYHFDDTDPTEDPESVLLDSLDLPFSVSGDWQQLDLPLSLSGVAGANMALVYVALDPPGADKSALEADDVELVEWRPASGMPDRLGRYDYVRNDGGAPVELTASVTSLRGP
jgi:poly-gamma-glutamate capsule biosynthesis protein CapA/YwtB (metallophosphatase superfamily)